MLLGLVLGGCDEEPDKPTPEPRPLVGDLLCLSMHIPLGDSAGELVERTRRLDHAEALGIRIVRRDISWSHIQPTADEWVWEGVDPGVQDVLDRGFELMALLVYGNPWASSATDDDKLYPPDDPADYARFAGAVAERYGDRVSLFEVWNEPNNGWRFWKPTVGGDPVAYGELLRAAAVSIRQQRPDAVVITGGTVFHTNVVLPSAMEFLEDHFAALPDAAADFDGLGWHPYPWYPPVVPPEEDGDPEMSFTHMAEELRAVLTAHEAADKPLYATEFGWPSYGEVTQLHQAAYLVRGTLWLAAVDARAACWYTLGDGRNTGQAPPESDFGLISWDVAADAPGDPKPSYYALQTLSSTLGDTAFTQDVTDSLELDLGAHALRFASPDGLRTVTVLWTVDDSETRTVRVPVGEGGGQVSVIDILGEPVVTQPSGDGVELPVTYLPRYVVEVRESSR